jgi:uncharacterized coiled-coil DUF342 family protein
MSDDLIRHVLAAVDRIDAGQTKLRTDLMARMDTLSNQITSLREDLVVNAGAYDTVRKTNDHTREEVRDLAGQFAAMQRQILLLGSRVTELENRPLSTPDK